MSDAARAKDMASQWLDERHRSNDKLRSNAELVEMLAVLLMAFAATQTAGKFVTDKVIEPQCLATGCEADVWRARKLRWEAQTAALRAALQDVIDCTRPDGLGGEREHPRWFVGQGCGPAFTKAIVRCRALLADAGQAGEEWRALNKLADVVRDAQPYRLWMSLEEAYAAVEKARQR